MISRPPWKLPSNPITDRLKETENRDPFTKAEPPCGNYVLGDKHSSLNPVVPEILQSLLLETCQHPCRTLTLEGTSMPATRIDYYVPRIDTCTQQKFAGLLNPSTYMRCSRDCVVCWQSLLGSRARETEADNAGRICKIDEDEAGFIF